MNADLSTGEETMMRTMAAAAPVKRRSSFGHYFATRGWVHLVLLTGVAIFLFPFIWMLGVSFKTDEEVSKADLWPAMPRTVELSPYLRDPPKIDVPAAVSERLPGGENELVKALRYRAWFRLSEWKTPSEVADAIAEQLVHDGIVRLNYSGLWSPTTIADQFDAQLTREARDAALSTLTAKFELRGVYARTFDGQVINLCSAKDVATRWRVVEGNATIEPSTAGGVIRYDFTRSEKPIVLEFAYAPPPGHTSPEKLVVSYLPDDSWHRVDAEVRVLDGVWRSDRANYLAQNRPASFTFQTASYEDNTFKAKTWTPLVPIASIEPPLAGPMATLRLTISPSSKMGATWTKATRNYLRAFRSVPFWRYVVNSLCLVVLMTTGAVFQQHVRRICVCAIELARAGRRVHHSALNDDAAGGR